MKKGCYYRKGASVIYHYKVLRRVYWSDCNLKRKNYVSRFDNQ